MEGEYLSLGLRVDSVLYLGVLKKRGGGAGKEGEGEAGKREGGKALQPWHGPSQKGDK